MDLRLTLLKGSKSLVNRYRRYDGYDGVVRDKNKVFLSPCSPRRRRSCLWH
jgi:hypothetical protein